MYEIPNCFTIETSNGSYYNSTTQETVEFSCKEWLDFGLILGYSVKEFIAKIIDYEYQINERSI